MAFSCAELTMRSRPICVRSLTFLKPALTVLPKPVAILSRRVHPLWPSVVASDAVASAGRRLRPDWASLNVPALSAERDLRSCAITPGQQQARQRPEALAAEHGAAGRQQLVPPRRG